MCKYFFKHFFFETFLAFFNSKFLKKMIIHVVLYALYMKIEIQFLFCCQKKKIETYQ